MAFCPIDIACYVTIYVIVILYRWQLHLPLDGYGGFMLPNIPGICETSACFCAIDSKQTTTV